MVSLQDANSYSHSHTISNITNSTTSARFQQTRPYYYTPSPSYSSKIQRSMGRSMRTIRSTFFQTDDENSGQESANLTDSDIQLGELTTKPDHITTDSTSNQEFLDMSRTRSISDFSAYSSDIRLGESATKPNHSKKNSISNEDFLDMSRTISDFSAYSSDISGELERLASVRDLGFQNPGIYSGSERDLEPEPCYGFLERESFSTEIIDNISPEDLQPTIKLCVDGLNSSSLAIKRSAAAKLRLLAKNRAENRALIGESGAISALVPLLRCSDPLIQENAVTALLNLSLHDDNKRIISTSGSIKSLIYVLKTGTDTSKQNAACALLSLALVDENKVSIGACGAIHPLVALLINGTNRGKKDALTTLYKLCSVRLNKERAVSAGAVRPLVAMVMENGPGLAEKAMVVLSSLAAVERGREAIVEEGGIGALVVAIEAGSGKGREFAVLTLLQMCAESFRNRNLLVREGGIPPLVALSQNGSAKAKHKAGTLLGYLREPRQEASTSTP